MSRRLGAIVVMGLLVLSACERREAAAPSPEAARFSHRLSADISGDYRPVGEHSGQAASLFVGQAAAFTAWEAGQGGPPPLILSLTGPQGPIQVTPDAYAITDDTVQMSGSTPGGGVVRLQGRINQGALATARRNLGDQTPVITGTVSVDGQRTAFALGWWGGD